MQTLPRKKPSLAKRIFKIAPGIVVGTIVLIGAIIAVLILVPWSSDPEPMTVQAVNSRFGRMFPPQSTVIDNEYYRPFDSFGYYAVVRLPQQDIGPFLLDLGTVIHSPSVEAKAKKLIRQDWLNMGEFWASWTIGHASRYKIAWSSGTQIFVDLDDPKVATVYVLQHEDGT